MTRRRATVLVLLLLILVGLEFGRRQLADALLVRGREAMQSHDLMVAEGHLRWAARLRPWNAQIRLARASCLAAQGDSRGAERLLTSLNTKDLDDTEHWRTRVMTAEGAATQGRAEEAVEALQQLLAEANSDQATEHSATSRARLLRVLGRTLHSELGRSDEAETALRQALLAATTAPHASRLDEALTLLDLEVFNRVHRRGGAEDNSALIEQALTIFVELEHPAGQGSALIAMSRHRPAAGDLPRQTELPGQTEQPGQTELLRRAESLFAQAGYLRGLGLIDFYRGVHAASLERYPEALVIFRRCRNYFERLGWRSGARAAEMGLARVQLRTEQLDAARATLEGPLESLGPTVHRRYALMLLGHVRLHAGDPLGASEIYRQVLLLDRQLGLGDPTQLANTLTMLGQAGLQMGDLSTARQSLEEARQLARQQDDANSLLVALLSSADLAALELTHWADDGPASDASASDTVNYLQAAAALQDDTLQGANGEASPFISTHFWQSLERLRWLLLEWNLESETKQRAHQVVFRLLEQMRQRFPVGRPHPSSSSEAHHVHSIQLPQLQAALAADEAVVLYAFGDQKVFALLVGNEAEVAVALPLQRQELIDRVGLLVRLLEDRIAAPEGASGDPTPWQPLAQALHAQLIEPLYAAGLQRGMQLGVVPIGALHDLPFAALLDADGSFLIEQHVLWTAPSAAAMLPRGEVVSKGHISFGVEQGIEGPRLSAAAAEARQLARLMGGQAWTGPEATEAAFRAQLPARLIHLAAHGEVEPETPLGSRLAFADDTLNVAEILDLDLRSELLVLSSCQASASFSARSDDWAGQRWGLSDAFLAAGTHRVLANRLPIDDAQTPEFMRQFYIELRSANPAEALNRVQRRRLREPSLDWIGWQLIGRHPAADERPLLAN